MDRAHSCHRDVLPSSGEHLLELASGLRLRHYYGRSRSYRLVLVLARDYFHVGLTLRLSSTVSPAAGVA